MGDGDSGKDSGKDEWWKKDDKPKEDSKDEWWKKDDKSKETWSASGEEKDASWQGADGQREDDQNYNEQEPPEEPLEEEPPEEPLADVFSLLGKRPAEDHDETQPSKFARVDDTDAMESTVEDLVRAGEGSKLSVGDLKGWLEERGLPTSGIKSILIERIQEEIAQAESGTA